MAVLRICSCCGKLKTIVTCPDDYAVIYYCETCPGEHEYSYPQVPKPLPIPVPIYSRFEILDI